MRDWLRSSGVPCGQSSAEIAYQGQYEMYVQDHKERCLAAIQQRFPSLNRQGIKEEFERARNAGELQYLNIDPSRYSRAQRRPVRPLRQTPVAVNFQTPWPLFQVPAAATRAISIVSPETRTTGSLPTANVRVTIVNPETGVPITLPERHRACAPLPAVATLASWSNDASHTVFHDPYGVGRWVWDGSFSPPRDVRCNGASLESEGATDGSSTRRDPSSRSSPPSSRRIPELPRNSAGSRRGSPPERVITSRPVPPGCDPKTVRGSKEWREYCIEVFVDCARDNGTGKIWYSDEERVPIPYHLLACRDGDKEGEQYPPEVWLEDVEDEKARAEWWERVWPGWREEYPEWSSL